MPPFVMNTNPLDGMKGEPELPIPPTRAALQAEIGVECARQESLVLAGGSGLGTGTGRGASVLRGRELLAPYPRTPALQNLLFFTPPPAFPARLAALCQELQASGATDEGAHIQRLQFLADCYLSLVSFLPRWNLQNSDRHADQALSERQVAQAAGQVFDLAIELAEQAPGPAVALMERWRRETTARFTAERAAAPEATASALVGNSIADYLANMQAELAQSNLRRICEAGASVKRGAGGGTRTEISNDYAAFLPHAMYLGASFATTNPPLVEIAWQTDPAQWDPVVDRIIATHPAASIEELARLATLEIVLANMRLLRPIFLLTAGQMGQVCLQVNPHAHGNADKMLADALFLYETLRSRLAGGIPNVLFKLPGTQAGLETCRALTRRGIGVTITVEFGMFQHLPFAEAIQAGEAICSCLVEMNGRLAFPVRDELLSRLDELVQSGIDAAAARQAAAWAGIAVAKRLYTLLARRKIEHGKIKLLIASLRIYEGAGYEALPSACPDITELLGADLISVFPNIRRPFDSWPGLRLDPQRIAAPVPPEMLAILSHSQLFRQAYDVGIRQAEFNIRQAEFNDPDWLPDEPEGFRPTEPLRLDQAAGQYTAAGYCRAATAAWTPVHNTLTEFCDSYDRFANRIVERKALQDTGRVLLGY